jgi:hypothetical protein
MTSFQRSLALLKASHQVVAINPSLGWYPFVALGGFILSLVAVAGPTLGIAMYILFRLGLLTQANVEQWLSSGPSLHAWPIFLVAFLYILIVQWIVVFVNSAFYLAADAALQGERLALRAALAQAWKRRWRITQWAFASAVMGAVIQIGREKLDWVGSLGVTLVDLAWSLATIFAIPVLVRKDVGPRQVLKESITLFKRTWGENLTANASLSTISVLIGFFTFLLPLFGVVALVINQYITVALGIALGTVLFGWLVFMVAYFTSLQTVYNAALYRYAETGDYVGPFSREMIEGAYTPKKSSLNFHKVEL